MTTRTVNGEPQQQQQQQQQRQQQQQQQQQRQQQQRRQPHYASGRPHRPYSSSSYYEGAGGGGGSASLKGCCCCLFLLLIFLALLAVAVVLVVVLVVKPRKPQFDLQQVSVQYLLVASPSAPAAASSSSSSSSPSDSNSAYLSLNITLLFTAENPNKVGIRYGPTAFDVMYRGVPLGVAAVPGFEQPAHSTRLVQTRFSVDRFNVLQSDALDLLRDAALNDRVDLRLTGDIDANIRLLGFTSPRVRVSVDCAIAISPRRQSLTYKQCGVDGVNL